MLADSAVLLSVVVLAAIAVSVIFLWSDVRTRFRGWLRGEKPPEYKEPPPSDPYDPFDG